MSSLVDIFGPLPGQIDEPPPPHPDQAGEPEPPQEIVTTPSGIQVSFQTEPKRQYKLRQPSTASPHLSIVADWVEVPSVTEILSVLEKKGLPWWGQGVGVQGVCALYEAKKLLPLWWTQPDAVVNQLTAERLSVNHQRDRAGDRGSSVHTALEAWAETKTLPDPEMWPTDEQGYVTALRRFLEESRIEPQRSEVMVGSLEHGYAGRYDLDAWFVGEEVCTYLTKQGKGDKREVIEPGFGRLDLKTSKSIYPESHYRQLAAYEQAAVECGYEKSDFRAVVNVQSDGRYQVRVVPDTVTFNDFKCVLDVFLSNQTLKGKIG